MGLSDFEIREAFEVTIKYSDTTEDPIEYDFKWEIKSFTANGAEIQVYFTAPESISSIPTDPDIIKITFWADDLFKAENGKTIRRGLTLQAPIIRQVNSDDSKNFKMYGEILGYLTLALLAIGLVWSFNVDADPLPIWTCYDSLVLISHLPLVNASIPGGMTIFLSTVAKILRFGFIPYDRWIAKSADVVLSNSTYNLIFD